MIQSALIKRILSIFAFVLKILIMNKFIAWLKESNRWKHLVCGCVVGLASNDAYCAALAGTGVASALEYKDKAWGGKWDWIDWGITLVGVIVGFLIGMLAWR